MTSFYQELNQTGKMSDEKENAQSRASVDRWIFRLLLLLIGVMPLIVLANVEQVVSPLISNIDVLASGTKGDLFTHYKALFVIVITVITGAMLLVKVLFMDGKIRKTPINYAIGLFAFAIIISTVFSPNITIALNGQYNRSDGAISWLCYLALMFIAMNIEYPKNVVKYVTYTMYPFVLLNLYIIAMHFYGKDLLQYQWVKNIVSILLPDGATISEGSQLVGTLNQWNYMSGMFAMMTILFLSWAIIDTLWIRSIVNTFIALISVAVMLMSVSTSGFLTMIIISPALVILIFKVKKKIKGAVILALFLVISVPTLNVLAQQNPGVWTESIGTFIKENPYTPTETSSTENVNLLNKVYASNNSLELPELPESSVSAGSGRLYIWSKTIELLKERPILGYGLDTLVYNFSHTNIDIRGGMGDENIITDKPHNVFVGLLYGTGIIGFIAVVMICILLFINIIKYFFRENNSFYLVFGLSSLAFLVQALFNDFVPGTASIGWIFIGLTFGLLKSFKNTREEI